MTMQMVLTSQKTLPAKDLQGSASSAKNADHVMKQGSPAEKSAVADIDFMSLLLGLQNSNNQEKNTTDHHGTSNIQINANGTMMFQMAQFDDGAGNGNGNGQAGLTAMSQFFDAQTAAASDEKDLPIHPFQALMTPTLDAQTFQTLGQGDDAAGDLMAERLFSLTLDTQAVTEQATDKPLNIERLFGLSQGDDQATHKAMLNNLGISTQAQGNILFDMPAQNNMQMATSQTGFTNVTSNTVLAAEAGANINAVLASQQATPAWQSEGWSSQAQSLMKSGMQTYRKNASMMTQQNNPMGSLTGSIAAQGANLTNNVINAALLGGHNLQANAATGAEAALKQGGGEGILKFDMMLTDPLAQGAQSQNALNNPLLAGGNPYADELNVAARSDAMRTDPMPAHGTQTFQAHLTSSRAPFFPAQATQNVAFQLQQGAQGKMDQMNIQMNPPELGRLKIKLQFGSAGEVKAQIIAEKQDTLDMLKRDSKALAEALANAGFDAGDSSLEFSLGSGQDFEAMKENFERLTIRGLEGDNGDETANITNEQMMESAKGIISMDMVNILV